MSNLLSYNDLNDFVNQEIEIFHNARLSRLASIQLKGVLKRKNPYLFRAKNITTAPEFVHGILEAFLSSSEEELFGGFLETLAIYISSVVTHGRKSSAEGIDLEFDREGVRYLVAIKSGTNWGNSSQYKRLEDNFKKAISVQRQSSLMKQVEAVLGMCYGKTKTVHTGVYTKISGQRFWEFVSGDPQLYLKIIEPIGFNALHHQQSFLVKRAELEQYLIEGFTQEFCYSDGTIDWDKIVAFNSGG